MKYKEFREYLKLNEIHFQEDEESLVANYHIEISKTEEHRIVFLINNIKHPYEYKMLKKAIELAETPLSERVEEKKYYLKHRFINYNTAGEYLNLSATEKVILNNHCEGEGFKTKFTKAEIEKFKEKFNTDLSDFELIEVED